jgi:acyl-CoA dehydrogenase
MDNPFDTEERRAFREAVRRYTEEEIRPNADEWDERSECPRHVHEGLGAIGIYGFGIEEQYGGLGFDDAFMRAAVAEELARCGATGIWAATTIRNVSTGPIATLANEEIKARVLPDILSGRGVSCLAVTEPSGGSDVANMKTSAVRDGDCYVLDGSKTFITGGMEGSCFVVAARTGDAGLGGISLFLVERDTPGFTQTPLDRKMGWWSSNTATLYFDNCRVPASHLLGEESRGFLAIMKNFNYERLSLACGALGMMKTCLDESISWARDRETFGQRLIDHQVIRHKIADMSAKIDMIESYQNQICWLINERDFPVEQISKLKFSATKALEFCASEAMQIFGGAAILRGNPVERIYREAKVFAIGGGSEEIMRDLSVRQMGL